MNLVHLEIYILYIIMKLHNFKFELHRGTMPITYDMDIVLNLAPTCMSVVYINIAISPVRDTKLIA